MRKLLVAAILLVGGHCLAQCPFAAALQNKGSLCLGKDTLVVASANKLASIKWYKNGVVDTVVNALLKYNPNGITVAGGNGQGNAANQFDALYGICLDKDGNIYVADGNNQRIQKFPIGSNSATNGTTVAGGKGLTPSGPIALLYRPSSVYVDGNGYIYACDQDNTGRIKKFPPNSVIGTTYTVIAGGNGLGSASNQLDNYCSVFVDGGGNIYVADSKNNRVQKFPPNSTSLTNGITIAGGNGAGAAANQLNYPFSVFVDGKGNVFVSDLMNNRIQEFLPGSTNGITVAGGNGIGTSTNQFIPWSVFVDGAGDIYVSDPSNNRILKFPSTSSNATYGAIVAGGNGAGSGASQLNGPSTVWVDGSGTIFICDDGNDRIQKFSPYTTSIIDNTTRIPTAPGNYYAVVTDTSGCTVTTNSIVITAPVTPTINISTYGSASVCSASNTISFKATTTNGGAAPKFQWMVNGVNTGTNDSTFTSSFANGDVVACTLASNAPCAITPIVVSNKDTVKLGTPPIATLYLRSGLCLGRDTLVVSSPNNDIASIAWYNGGMLDTTVKAVEKYPVNCTTVAGGNGPGAAATQFNLPSSVYIDALGNIIVPDLGNGRVQKFPSNSTSATNGVTIAGGNGLGAAANQLNKPYSVAVDQNGNLYVADTYNNRVQMFPPGSTSTSNGITVAGGNGFGGAPNQLNNPDYVCVDAHNNIYVLDAGNNRVQLFPPASTTATNGTTVAGGNGQGSAANQLNGPGAMCMAANGDIYVADNGNNRIQKFLAGSSSSTNGITVAGGNGFGSNANQFAQPDGVHLDINGNIYVSDYGNNRIQKFPPNSSSNTNGITVIGGNGAGNSGNQLSAPWDVFVDKNDDIYVADGNNNRIQKFSMYNYIDTTYIIFTAGMYKAVVTDSFGCTITTNAVTIAPATSPTVNINADKTSVCTGNTLVFTATVANVISPASYQWLVNGTDVGTNAASYSSSVLQNGDSVACIVSNGSGCVGTDTSNTIVANVKPSPTVGPATDVFISLGQSTVLNMPVSGNIASYVWSPANYLSNNSILNPTTTPLKTTTYTLKVVSVDSCAASDSLTVTVSSNIYFSSGFTPNGDGRNDVFYVLGGLAGDKVKDFSIFDRWGKRLFQVQNVLPNDKTFGWDGRLNGTLLPSGSYVYVATITSANGTEKKYEGTVVLMR